MFPTITKTFPLIAATLCLTFAAQAQGGLPTGGIIITGGIWIPSTPPVLPSVQSSYNSYDRGIGNGWLGGSVHAYANMVRQKSGTYELGFAAAEFRGTASVLNHSAEVAEIVGNATNVMNAGVQNRSGMYRVEVLGFTVTNGSFTSNSTFAAQNSVYNLLPSGVSVSVPVGPISVTLSGNAGCGFGRSANWLLPAATASVGINASANAYAFANASVSFGIPGFNVGVGIQGRVLEQTLTTGLNANAVWGLSGHATYTLQAISLHLYAWATALYTWTTNLCSWSSGLLSFNLI